MQESYDDETANDYLDEIDDSISDIKTLIHKINNLNTSQDIQARYSNTMQELYDYLRHL